MILKMLELLASKFGIKIIAKWKLDNYLLCKRLSRIINSYKIDCIFDVGANIGQYRDFLRNEVGYEGLIISFEPDPNNIAALKNNKNDDKWIIKEYALGEKDSNLELNIMKSSVFNSFLEPDKSGTSLFEDSNAVDNTIDVEVKRLDSIFFELEDTFQFKKVFLKLDTQGFDLEVFEGASGCMKSIYGVQTEVSVMPIYKDMPTIEDSLKLFKEKGFEVSGLYSISEDRFPHAIEFDCIYLRK